MSAPENAASNQTKTVAVDCFVRGFPGFRPGHAVAAVDVIRATTTAATAAVMGRRCLLASTIDAAIQLAERLENPILAGEMGGNVPYAFDMDNSPADVADRRDDLMRPLVLVSTTGTELLCRAAEAAPAVFAASLRNFSAQAAMLMQFQKVAIIGAGSRGEFREEDQLCCARIAERLVRAGYTPEGRASALIERWRDASVTDFLGSNSVRFLRSTGRERDIDFILEHVDDIDGVFEIVDGEVVMRPIRS